MKTPRLPRRLVRPLEGGRFAGLVDDLYQTGINVPGCGGSPGTHPSWSIAKLQPVYGDSLGPACLEFVLNCLLLERLPECCEYIAAGIVYQSGDETALPPLVALWKEIGAEPFPHMSPQAYRVAMIRCLVAALCQRHGRPLPDGCDPLCEQMAYILFEG
jgi:hypothetical protein